jgi:hypothetical protein
MISKPAMDNRSPDNFEMRRLESLSNTVFGVAMTLLAYDLPRASPRWRKMCSGFPKRSCLMRRPESDDGST